jgi:hypothetical protein
MSTYNDYDERPDDTIMRCSRRCGDCGGSGCGITLGELRAQAEARESVYERDREALLEPSEPVDSWDDGDSDDDEPESAPEPEPAPGAAETPCNSPHRIQYTTYRGGMFTVSSAGEAAATCGGSAAIAASYLRHLKQPADYRIYDAKGVRLHMSERTDTLHNRLLCILPTLKDAQYPLRIQFSDAQDHWDEDVLMVINISTEESRKAHRTNAIENGVRMQDERRYAESGNIHDAAAEYYGGEW